LQIFSPEVTLICDQALINIGAYDLEFLDWYVQCLWQRLCLVCRKSGFKSRDGCSWL